MSTSGGKGGGATPGAAIVRAFPFAYNTPDLLTGAALYTPTVGDVLLGLSVIATTAWDGTTPLCDVGGFTEVVNGVFYNNGMGPIDMAIVGEGDFPPFNVQSVVNAIGLSTAIDAGGNVWEIPAIASVPSPATSLQPTGSPFSTQWGGVDLTPFISADPIRVCVSQDGSTTGADPGSTQGAAVLYVVTATPA